MKKEILNEVNRAREIMGLAQLISEQLRVQTTLPNTAPAIPVGLTRLSISCSNLS